MQQQPSQPLPPADPVIHLSNATASTCPSVLTKKIPRPGYILSPLKRQICVLHSQGPQSVIRKSLCSFTEFPPSEAYLNTMTVVGLSPATGQVPAATCTWEGRRPLWSASMKAQNASCASYRCLAGMMVSTSQHEVG